MTKQKSDALNEVIDAWEALPGGRHHSIVDVQEWLVETMKPAIDNARRAIGRKVPHA